MTTEKDIEDAVQAERERCVALLEFYRKEFEGTPLNQLWYRIRNQIAIGTPVQKADFLSQLFDDEDEEDYED